MRLTNPIRNRILNALDDRRREERFKVHHENEQRLAMTLYRRTVTEEIEAKADELNKLVPGMCRTGSNVYADLQDSYSGYLFMGHQRPAPSGQVNAVVRSDDELFKELEAHMRERNEWQENNKKANMVAKATLAGFKTVEQMAASWPEIMTIAKPIIDAFAEEQAAKAAVPAIVPAELNNMFALPVEAEKELEAA